MIEIKNFNEKVSKNLARLVEKTEENIVVAYKDFDLEQAKLGLVVELPEQISTQNIKELENKKLALQAEIAEIDAFLAQK